MATSKQLKLVHAHFLVITPYITLILALVSPGYFGESPLPFSEITVLDINEEQTNEMSISISIAIPYYWMKSQYYFSFYSSQFMFCDSVVVISFVGKCNKWRNSRSSFHANDH